MQYNNYTNLEIIKTTSTTNAWIIIYGMVNNILSTDFSYVPHPRALANSIYKEIFR